MEYAVPQHRSFHVMAKPVGPLCNLDCAYCFYLEKAGLFPEDERFRMCDDVLEAFVRKYVQAQTGPEVEFAWQGGEPTLAGLDFFRKAVALQKLHAGGRPVRNALQTNGTELDDAWCEFLARERFLVGLSLDGPQPIHDRYRRDRAGAGSFERVMRALRLLQRHGVEYNVLTCVTRQSPDEALDVYRFLRDEAGVRHVQFIPIVERVGDRATLERGLKLAAPPDLRKGGDGRPQTTPWSVSRDGFGDFLIAVFDEWVRRDVGKVFVNIFDVMLSAWSGLEPGLCVFARHCGNAVAMEHDGDLYACDHFVYPEYRLGNACDRTLEEMVWSERQIRFGRDKRDALPKQCRECEFLFACNGECPKHRFAAAADGEPGLNWLCPGLLRFFRHIDAPMRRMADLVKAGRPASEIMVGASSPPAARPPGRNDPCPCGSGRKFKKCCGRAG